MQANVLLVLFALTFPASALYREECNATVTKMLLDGSLSLTDNVTFYTNKSGFIMSDLNNPILTLDGCERLCGASQEWYKDIGPRLNVWLIPVILLVVNMEVSPLDKRKYVTVIHLLGDPIDSLWSLLSKVEAWSRCYGMAQKDLQSIPAGGNRLIEVKTLATILGGIEEIVGPRHNPLRIFNKLIPRHKRANLSRQMSITAYKLAASRTDDLVRTAFAVILYIYQMIAAFVSVIGGGNSSPPGGRIGTAMFLTWLVPIILLSNSVGGFNSGTSCFDIMRELCDKACMEAHGQAPCDHKHKNILTYWMHNGDEYFQDKSQSGAIYTYLCQKGATFKGQYHNYSQFHLLCVAVSPILTASIFGSSIIWNTPPGGFNCRNIMLIVITIVWLLSVVLTWLISKVHWRKKMTGWYMVLVKDAAFAIASVVMIFLSSAGIFNSCRCWIGTYYLGRSQGQVPLNPSAFFEHNLNHLYPYLVGGCLVLQLLIFAYIYFTGRRGLKVMRWSGKEKMALHRRIL